MVVTAAEARDLMALRVQRQHDAVYAAIREAASDGADFVCVDVTDDFDIEDLRSHGFKAVRAAPGMKEYSYMWEISW